LRSMNLSPIPSNFPDSENCQNVQPELDFHGSGVFGLAALV